MLSLRALSTKNAYKFWFHEVIGLWLRNLNYAISGML